MDAEEPEGQHGGHRSEKTSALAIEEEVLLSNGASAP